MKTFEVDDDLVELVWKLANPQPFESLTFSAALRRVLATPRASEEAARESGKSLDELVAELLASSPPGSKKAPTPDASEWASTVPELRGKRHLNSWKAICDELGIDPAGDSARRKLQVWVAANRPKWPAVPDPRAVGA